MLSSQAKDRLTKLFQDAFLAAKGGWTIPDVLLQIDEILKQPVSFSSAIAQAEPEFAGETYQPERDKERLTRQLHAVLELMKDGQWRTLKEIAQVTGAPEASASARLRDLRRPEFGNHVVNRRYLQNGIWAYQLVYREPAPLP